MLYYNEDSEPDEDDGTDAPELDEDSELSVPDEEELSGPEE